MKGEYEAKLKFNEAIQHLFNAKNMIEEAKIDLYSVMKLLIKSELFTDEQKLKYQGINEAHQKGWTFRNASEEGNNYHKYNVSTVEEQSINKDSVDEDLKEPEKNMSVKFITFSFPS